MKATFQIPDELYREVKAEAAREGRTLRDVTISHFRVMAAGPETHGEPSAVSRLAEIQSSAGSSGSGK